MSTFTDDFNRGDGGIGNNWQYFNAGGVISSNHVVMPQYGYNYNPACNASGRQEVSLRFQSGTAVALGAGILLKWSSTGPSGYVCVVTGTGAAPVYHIKRLVSGSYPVDYNVAGSGLSDGWHTLRAVYYNGIVTVWIDGALVAQTADSTHGALTGAGIHSWVANQPIDDFYFIGDESLTFTVSPSPIGNFGNTTHLTFTGVSTMWTPGIPGAPIFTVDHGVLSAQLVISATAAEADYTPGTFLGIATFADPSTGATCMVTVTSDTTIVFPPSGVGGLAAKVITWLENQADHGGLVIAEQETAGDETEGIYAKGAFGELLVGKRVTVGPGVVTAPEPAAIYQLWRLINGGADSIYGPYPAVSTTNVKQDLDYLMGRFDSTGPEPWTIDQLANLLAGDPFTSNQDIITALDGLEVGVDLQPVLDALAALRGNDSATVSALVSSLGALRTNENFTLGSVKAWIDALPQTQGAISAAAIVAVIAALALAIPSGGTSVAVAAAAVGAGPLLDLATIVEVVAVLSDIAALAIQVQDIKDALAAPAPVGPPVWIDEAHATVEDPVALADGLELTGPLDGVLVTITGQPSGASKFAFGALKSWRYVGALIFQSDRGDWEWAQPIGMEAQIITPRTMQHAAAVRFRLESGWEGTASAFTVTAGT